MSVSQVFSFFKCKEKEKERKREKKENEMYISAMNLFTYLRVEIFAVGRGGVRCDIFKTVKIFKEYLGLWGGG